MNRLTSRQRKLLYAVGIIVLLGPIVYLGFPVQQSVHGATSTGLGKLGHLRQDYDLGEATLGEVDPSSSVMNLVLLGLRGPAASLLHLKAIEYQEHKQWAKLRTTVDSIILLQPHYVQIWKFQGWNLAYNVSREWDQVDDRFYWVKEGIKFLKVGTSRNETVPIMEHNVGEVIEKKMGTSDEKKFFREFFVHDPDEKFKDPKSGIHGADPKINPGSKDSYLVAREHYLVANVKDDNDGLVEVDGMTHVFFRQGPAKAMLNYAEALTKEGTFFGDGVSPEPGNDVNKPTAAEPQNLQSTATARHWQQGFDEWMGEKPGLETNYGKYVFLGRDNHGYMLNSSEKDLENMAQENGIDLREQRDVWSRSVDMVNYRFWRDYAQMESDPIVIEAHKSFFDAKRAYAEGRGYDPTDPTDGSLQISEAQKMLEVSMRDWQQALTKYERFYADNTSYLEEAMLVVRYWQAVHLLNGKPVATDYPLKNVWENNGDQHLAIDHLFLMETRSQRK